MKLSRRTLFLLSLASLPLFGGDFFGKASAQTADGVISLGYNSQTASSWWSTPVPQSGVEDGVHSYHAAICLPSQILDKYAGDKIESIQFAISKKTASSVYAFVVSDDLDNVASGNILASVSTTDFEEGWNTLKLNTPVTITRGMTLYVGYILSIPSGQDVTGIPFETYGEVSKGSTFFGLDFNWWDITASNMTYSLPLRAICSGSTVPNGDVEISALSSSSDYYVEKNSEATYTAWVRNFGLEPVESITFSVKANGEVSEETTVTGLHIEHGTQQQVEIPGVKIPVEGDFVATVSAVKVNGADDPDQTDNESTTKGFAWREGGYAVQRHTLLEHFTNEGYNQGKLVDQLYAQWMAGYKNSTVWVKHHIATGKFEADQFTLDAEKPYLSLYGETATDVPFISLDRQTFSGMEDDGPAYYVANQDQFKTMLASTLNVPSFVELNIDGTLSSDQSSLTAAIGLTSQASSMPSQEDLRLTTWLVEDSVVSTSQAGVKGEYLQDGVMRAILSEDAWGDPVDVSGYADTKTYTVSLDPSWNVSHLRIVSFVSNYTASAKKRQVYNAAQQTVSVTSGIADVTDGSSRVLEVYDLSGRKMPQTDLPAGIYVFKTTTGTRKAFVK